MGYIRKRTAVDKCRCSLECLYKIWFNSIHQQDRYRSGYTKIAHGEWLVVERYTENHVLNTPTEISLTVSKTQCGHDFAGRSNIKARLCRQAVGCVSKTSDDITQAAVVDIQDTFPQNLFQCKSLAAMLVDIVVQQSCYHVVRTRDGMEVTGEVEIDLLHRDHLGITAAGSPTLHAETRSETRLAQGEYRAFSNAVECHGESDADGRFTDSGTCGGNRTDEDETVAGNTILIDQ